jgi:WD40 repeat protein
MQSGVAEINGYRTEEFEEIKGILPREKSDKPKVEIFLSYSHNDKTHKSRFFELISNRLKTSKLYDFSFSVDTDILVGEKWHDEIQKMVKQCDFGLLLLSTNFLNSEYISNHELPRLLEKCIPVALNILDFKRQDLKGLQENQIFRYEEKAFSELREPNLTRFVNELARQVEERVEKAQKAQPSPLQEEMEELYEKAGIRGALQGHALLEQMHERRSKGYEGYLFTHQRGIRGAITHQTRERGGDTINVLDHLQTWAVKGDTPFFALLGDFGAGKTFTCRMLARKITEEHNSKPDEIPLCIYIDLRFVSTRNKENRIPSLVEILDDAIRQAKDPLDKSIVKAEDLIQLTRQGKAMIIYDGLDEKTVHFTPDETNEFVRQLWSIREIRPEKDEKGPRQGKILVSCRTHYFRDVIEQNSLFLGKDREGRGTREFSSCVILPFDDSQIRDCLHKKIGCDDAEINRLIDLMGSVHNLRELARRPYLLSLISEFLPDIEKMGTGSKIMNTASLYELMVQNWLSRDDGKHEFGVSHKKTLMEAMALEIHQRGERSIKTEDLEEWLDQWLLQNPAIQSAYTNINRETLKKDLRTATFIIREQDKDFRFAHTSLQEYFLARHIINLLSRRTFDIPKDIQGLAMPFPSRETLDFAVEILANEKGKAAFLLKNMEALLERAYEKGASELCIGLWQRLRDKEMETPNPKTVRLEGALLKGWKISSLDFSKAVFDRANLEDARFEEVQLPAASFVSAKMLNAEFLHCSLAGGDFSSATAQGSVWKECNLSSTKWEEANTRLADFVRCEMADVDLAPEESRNIVLCNDMEATPRPRDFHIDAFTGHSDLISSCAVSPDNRRIVSASSDNTLKVWDAETGKCLKTFEGHTGAVTSCAVSPDNGKIVSASSDKTLKVWDAETGKCLKTLEGHSGLVKSCAVSPDNRRIVSASSDNTLRLWDAKTGECLKTLEGHSGSVYYCALSPDKRRIVSTSDDKTLKVWDAETGECLKTLEGHSDSVNSCAVSPDKRRIVSASGNKTLKVWDAETGKCLKTLEGHYGVVLSCAVSPDNRRIVSASSDNTLKVWDAKTGECLKTLEGHYGVVLSCAVSPDNRMIVSASSDNTLKVWDMETGKCLKTLEGHSGEVESCAVSPDNGRIVSASNDNTLKVWDMETGKCLKTLKGHSKGVNSCAVSPDNRRIVSGSSDNTIKVWDLETGKCLRTLEGHSNSVNSCAVSPDNRRIVSASFDNTLKVWDIETGKCLKTLKGHSSCVNSCAVTSDNRRIVSASSDNTLKVWDLETGECLKTFIQLPEGETAAWDGEGKKLLSSSPNAWRWIGLSSGMRRFPIEALEAWVGTRDEG